MIGLSFARCIPDIAEGKVSMRDVEVIIADTNAPTSVEMEACITFYRDVCWPDADKCEEIFRQLLAQGKIEQPRVTGKGGPRMATTTEDVVYWVNSRSEIDWGDWYQ